MNDSSHGPQDPAGTNPFHAALEAQRVAGLLRTLSPLDGAPGKFVSCLVDGRSKRCLNLASNNYLDLAGHPHLRRRAQEALERGGTGSGGSRLLGGDLPLHGELEAAVEKYRPVSAGARALVFNTGFQANQTVVSALGQALGGVFADRLAHASVAEGLRTLTVPFHRFRHNDPAHLEELLRAHQPAAGGLVTAETLFSMDGDFAPVEALCELQKRYGFWLLWDEAHSTGGYPELHKRGLVGLPERTVFLGTFGKALGSFGAYVVGPPEIRDYLINFGRGFIFSTSLPPAVLGASLGGLEVAAHPREAWRAAKLAKTAAYARAALQAKGFDTGASVSHIVPVLLGAPERAAAFAAALRHEGIHAPAIRPPTVPAGTARLRLNFTAAFEESDVDTVVAALVRVREAVA